MDGKRFLAAAALATALIPPIAVSAEESRAVITEEWPPYSYAAGDDIAGYSTEVVRAIMRRLGIDLPIRILPGPRAKATLDAGGGVLFFSMFRTPEREGQYQWIGPIDETSFYFYRKKGSRLAVSTLDEARKVRSIACRNYGLVYEYLKGERFDNLDTSPNPDGIYRKVIEGRCDLAVGETPLGVRYILRKLGLPPDSLEPVELRILDSALYIVASKDLAGSEVARWRAALEAMRASGELGAIYDKYMR